MNPLDIVCFISRDWQEYQRKPHLKALSKYGPVLCVEPPITLLSPFFHLKKIKKYLKGERGIRKLGNNLYLYTPFSFFPYAISHLIPILKLVDKKLITYCTKRALNNLHMKCEVSFIFKPHQDFLLKSLNARLSCYEAVDQYSTYPNISKMEKMRRIEREMKILREADLVFVTSNNLMIEKIKFNRNTYFIPNTTDIHHFGKALLDETLIPKDLSIIAHPRIGFIGNINELLDLQLIYYIAESRTKWSIIMIGNITGTGRFKYSAEFKKLKGLNNIHYLGWRNHEDLPAYLRGFDVCILPYKTIEYMKYVYPNKIHQYLAAGKPVVTTNLPELFPFKDTIEIADNYNRFVIAIEEALKEDDKKLALQRIEIARSNSSENRAKQKIEIINSMLSEEKT
jgi:glycosyltransferase involved in cell wall biosynthesis